MAGSGDSAVEVGEPFTGLELDPLVEATGLSRPLVALAVSVCLPPMVSYEVLRAVRTALFPEMEGRAEAELAGSVVTRSSTTAGLVLEPTFRREALAALRNWQGADAAATTLTQLLPMTAGTDDDTSPLLVVETMLAWDYVSTSPEQLEDAVERRLHDVAVTAVAEGRRGIIEWSAAAQGRLPAPCWRGTSAWILAQLAAAERIDVAPVPIPAQLNPSGLLELAAHLLPVAVIGVQRRPGELELGPPTSERSIGLAVIDTRPFVIRISEHDEAGRRLPARQFHLGRQQTRVIPCSDRRITLGNLAGQSFTLAALDDGVSPESREAERAVDAALAVHAEQAPVPVTVVRRVEQGYVVAFEDMPLTGFLFSPRRILHPGDQLIVTISAIAPNRRWIGVKPVSSSLAELRRPGESIRRVPEANMPRRVRVGGEYPAQLIKHGVEREEGRSAHVYIESTTALGRIIFQHRRGHLRFPAAVQLVDDQWWPPIGSAMVITAAGMSAGEWELRLTPAEGGALPTTRPIGRDAKVRAEVTSLDVEGAWLETRDRKVLWMPREAMWPGEVSDSRRHLDVGQTIDARIIYQDIDKGYIGSQKALHEPFLDRFEIGASIQGTIVRSDASEVTMSIGATPRISATTFLATAQPRAGTVLRPGERVGGTVKAIWRSRWRLVVEDVAPLASGDT